MQSACPSPHTHTHTEVRVISSRTVEIILPNYLGRECPVIKVFSYSLQHRKLSTESHGCLSRMVTYLQISIHF